MKEGCNDFKLGKTTSAGFSNPADVRLLLKTYGSFHCFTIK